MPRLGIKSPRPGIFRDIEMDRQFKKIKASSNIKSLLLENTSQCDSQGDGKVYRHVKNQIDEWINNKHAKISELFKNLSKEHYSIRPAKEGTGIVVYCQLCEKEIKER